MTEIYGQNGFFNVIGRNLKVMRRKNGHTLVKMGDLLDISYQQYQKYEGGTSRLPIDKMYRLKHFYNVPYDDFFDGV